MKTGKFIVFAIMFLVACSNSNKYCEICNCSSTFSINDLTLIKKDVQEGFHGDGYTLIAYEYPKLPLTFINDLKSKGYVERSKVYIPALSELNAVLPYDSTQFCLIKDNSDNSKVFQTCIIDTMRRIIIAYQILQ